MQVFDLEPVDLVSAGQKLVDFHAEYAPRFRLKKASHWSLVSMQSQLTGQKHGNLSLLSNTTDSGNPQNMPWDDTHLLKKIQKGVDALICDKAELVWRGNIVVQQAKLITVKLEFFWLTHAMV